MSDVCLLDTMSIDVHSDRHFLCSFMLVVIPVGAWQAGIQTDLFFLRKIVAEILHSRQVVARAVL